MRYLLVLGLIGVLSGCSSNEELKPFTSDGCSSFPNGTRAQNSLWLSCCEQHDLAYWQGGTYQQRLEADNELKACVAGVGEPEIAALMLAGVRVGGSPFWPTEFRWGYGWPYLKPYGELSAAEQAQVKKLLPPRQP
ncbi:hypothetical protein Q4488_00695 [Amphritea sp. 1_MG-2023]|uniref:hypothetical protein n=1 Tax=Amphritea sp. 1_MG-2023 TaxID=3062670 RepID=UPI0026E40AC4|nr:hypothetical protein [Amphritea sp. 1_MG-2023]MDO6561889.1 hypothetical protein [Amphritea sp. 1_MG-2023]